ncbi:hypothetical protein [Halomarina pelagica]|uniref:hypothetical protein n=1 Tax=Halomarina pelagica TaxID=2961599 RepID=UPI0020C559DD|nr:hypothetical protein [Halomarina sp. BND7]
MDTWDRLFERAAALEASLDDVQRVLTERRKGGRSGRREGDRDSGDRRGDPDPGERR